jgi:hypothetical protein
VYDATLDFFPSFYLVLSAAGCLFAASIIYLALIRQRKHFRKQDRDNKLEKEKTETPPCSTLRGMRVSGKIVIACALQPGPFITSNPWKVAISMNDSIISLSSGK